MVLRVDIEGGMQHIFYEDGVSNRAISIDIIANFFSDNEREQELDLSISGGTANILENIEEELKEYLSLDSHCVSKLSEKIVELAQGKLTELIINLEKRLNEDIKNITGRDLKAKIDIRKTNSVMVVVDTYVKDFLSEDCLEELEDLLKEYSDNHISDLSAYISEANGMYVCGYVFQIKEGRLAIR